MLEILREEEDRVCLTLGKPAVVCYQSISIGADFAFHPAKMDVEYSIGVNNRFATLLSDEEDGEEVQAKEKDLKKEKAAKKTDKKVVKPAAKDSKPAGRKDVSNEETKRDGRCSV